MIEQLIEQSIHRVRTNPSIIGSLLALAAFYYIQYAYRHKKPALNVPRLSEEMNNAELEKTFQHHRDEMFSVIEPHGETVVLPVKFMEEIKNLPENEMSSVEGMNERFLTHQSMVTCPNHHDVAAATKSVRNELTRSLGNLMADLYDELLYSFDKEFPACDDWTEVNLNLIFVRIIALLSGRIFVGAPLNRTEEYIKCVTDFTTNTFFAIPVLRNYPAGTRWLAKFFSKEVQAINASLATMKKILKPIIADRIEGVDSSKQRDMITWNLKNSDQKQRNSLELQAKIQLSLSMAAIHTTSMTVSNALYDLIQFPENLGPIKEELASVRVEEKEPYLTKVSMPKLKLLDSFLKETQRVRPIFTLNMRRMTTSDVKLHDGTVLPKGTHIAFSQSQVAQNPEIYEDPEKFDGFRYAKLREQPDSANKYHFVSTSPEAFDFGHGQHACPGRFFANNEIKLILTHVLDNYDFKFKDGQGRPAQVPLPGGYTPDPTSTILMKKKQAPSS